VTWVRKVGRGETRVDFVGGRRRWFIISAALLAVSLGSLTFRQLNLGVEFTGGFAIQAENPGGATVADLRSALSDSGVSTATIQLLDDGAAVLVQSEALDVETENAALGAITNLTGTARSDISIDAIGPTFGALVARRALIALGVFVGAVVLFISWRLELKMALAGLAALGHDLLLTIGVYSVTGFAVTPATVVAILTILAYSLYDTVVVFDKVEELVDGDERSTYTEIVNVAMNQVLARSLMTSLTSLLPVGSIFLVGSFILGTHTLGDFALALFVGIATGTYSSIFVAAPLLATWKETEPEWGERWDRTVHRRG